ncbi:MAG TPA: type II toxin-antitoxin system RelE/ParE family toxin [Longimicrobium sp.]|nr:type II toxin-antitoxin system RelE/ParE family toxin [Longimicrobium sp.]
MRVRFHEYARREYLDAIRFLRDDDQQKAKDFVADVRQTVERIRLRPLAGTPAEFGTRRRYLLKFRYTIFYRIMDGEIEILAVMHQSRGPGYWYNRV